MLIVAIFFKILYNKTEIFIGEGSMSLQFILSTMRKAVEDYRMINDGDKVCVGLSGGKDSMVLLKALASYRIFSPQKFTLGAITIDMGFKDADFSGLEKFCEELDVDYHIEHTDIAEIVFNVRKEKAPCSLCSKMRRGALNTTLKKLGYNKLALGHHADDLVETFLLSLCYEGRLSTFAPISYMDRSDVTMIRPLIYTREKDIISVAKDLPIYKNPCPEDKETQREFMKNLIKNIQKDIPFAKDRMLGAITNAERYNLWDKYEKFPRRDEEKQ